MLLKQNPEILGVLGGMGPLASAGFLRTIYERNIQIYEQNAPSVILYSDPTFPDRTNAYLQKNTDDLLFRLTNALNYLTVGGAQKIVICCITSHYLLPLLPQELKEKVISLLDVIISEVSPGQKKHLLVCTRGTRMAGIFEKHPGWKSVKDKIIYPTDSEQNEIHDFIYQIKIDGDVKGLLAFLKTIAKKYETSSFIAGCTEIHLLTRYISALEDDQSLEYIDPLRIIANDLKKFIAQN